MQILALNAGSSSLKFQLSGGGRILAAGRLPADADAAPVLRDLSKAGIDAIGHRLVHGGPRLTAHARIDETVLREIKAVDDLAPLHNRPAVELIELARRELPSTPMVAVFDTAFFRDLPALAKSYAIPRELSAKHGIRRFGFHGLAHQSMWERCAALCRSEPTRMITLQLGSGCSAAALWNGKPMDTSMGFTPLEGLIMSTRCGDIDPGLVTYLANHENLSPDRLCHLLHERSGLLGVSGVSADIRELERKRESDPNAALALDLFCYRVRKYIGAFCAVLGGIDAIVFGGGIGQNSSAIRAGICGGLEWCGVRLNPDRNSRANGAEARISADESAVAVWVANVDEEKLIAEATERCLASCRSPELTV